METNRTPGTTERKRAKALGVLGISAAALLALAGCSGGGGSSSSESPSASSSASSSAAGPSSTSSSAESTTPSAQGPATPTESANPDGSDKSPGSGGQNGSGKPDDSDGQNGQTKPDQNPGQPQAEGICAGTQLQGSIANTGGAAGSAILQLNVTNASDTGCTLNGYPGVSMVGDGNGTQIGADATRDESKPSQGPIDLQPGASATLPMKMTNPQNFPTCNEHPVDGFRVYPPSATDAFFVSYPGTGCGNPTVQPLQIGAFQPATQ